MFRKLHETIYRYNEQDVGTTRRQRRHAVCVCCGRGDRSLAAKSVGWGTGLQPRRGGGRE